MLGEWGEPAEAAGGKVAFCVGASPLSTPQGLYLCPPFERDIVECKKKKINKKNLKVIRKI